MDYEKLYKKALERASKLRFQNPFNTVSQMMEHVFPELKESEDERIRKWIIDDIIYNMDNEPLNNSEYKKEAEKAISWLEKLGQQDDYDDNIITRDDEILQAISIGLADAEKDLGWSDFGGLPIEEIQEWLEKQGEKPTLPKWKYKKDNTPLLRDSIILNKYGGVAKSPSGAIVSDAWVLDYDELAKLPKEEITKQGEQKPVDVAASVAKAVSDAYPTFDLNWFKGCSLIKEKSPAESLGISQEKYEEIVNECIYGSDNEQVSSEKIGKNDILLDLLQKMPSCITVDGIDYHFVMKKTIAFMAFYEGEGEEGRDKIIFWMAGDPIDILTEMLEKLKEEGLLE